MEMNGQQTVIWEFPAKILRVLALNNKMFIVHLSASPSRSRIILIPFDDGPKKKKNEKPIVDFVFFIHIFQALTHTQTTYERYFFLFIHLFLIRFAPFSHSLTT